MLKQMVRKLWHPVGHLMGMSNPWGSNCETCRNECFKGLGTMWGTLLSAGRAEEGGALSAVQLFGRLAVLETHTLRY